MLSEPLLTAYTVFGAISLILYAWVIKTILTTALYRNPAYRLMAVLGFVVSNPLRLSL